MIYLAQTDTTAGFLSKDLKALNALKKRPLDQACLVTTAKLSELTKLTRVPNHFKNTVRKSKKTTFLYPNSKAIRVVKDCSHANFLKILTGFILLLQTNMEKALIINGLSAMQM